MTNNIWSINGSRKISLHVKFPILSFMKSHLWRLMLNSNLNFITSGGHGKRSDIPRIGLPLELPQDYSNTNKEVFVSSIILLLYKRVENTRENRREKKKGNTKHCHFYVIQNSANNELHGINQMELNDDNRWKTRQELTYALMNLLRKWVNFFSISVLCSTFLLFFHRLYIFFSLLFYLIFIDWRIEKEGRRYTAITRNWYNL